MQTKIGMASSAKRHMSLDTATAVLLRDSFQPPALTRRFSELPSLGISTATRKRVSFHAVGVAEHAFTLGDNVVSDDGAPLTIEWEAYANSVMSVDEYERSRVPRVHSNQRPRRLSAEERFCILSLNGIPMRSSLVAASESSQARSRREETAQEVREHALQQKNAQTKEMVAPKKTLFRRPKALWSKFRSG
jgi:hypothetical protein